MIVVKALARWAAERLRMGVSLVEKPRPEPEPINANPRPMVGFFAALTRVQQKHALAYRGPENLGEQHLAR